MTRLEIEQEVSAILREILGDVLEDSPLALRRDVWRAAEELADRFDCYKGTRTASIVANQAEYCIPGFKRLTGATYITVAGIKQAMPIRDVTWMDSHVPLWRDPVYNVPVPVASYYVMMSPQQFRIFPTPSDDRADAITLEGYMKPGEGWLWSRTSVNDPWTLQPAADSDECPLPPFAHAAVVQGAIVRRLRVLSARIEAARVSLPIQEAQYNRLCGEVEVASALFAARVPHHKGL